MRAAERTLAEDLAEMRDAARHAGHIALSYARAGDAKAWDKSPGHPVTEADLAVNTYLADRLRKFRPEYGWLSEETADQPSERRKNRTWVVDPIDGTRAFMRGDPHWCIGLAVVEEGISVASVLYAPVFDELFEARLSGGAYLNGIAMRTSETAAEAGSRLIVNQTLIDHPDWPAPWPEVVVSDPKPNATLYRLALVASGAWDATFVLFRKSDWDLAAGALLVEEAGGRVTTHIGEALQFNKAVPAQRSLLAAGKVLHPLLMRRMNRLELPDPNAS
ncbi:MAG: 3'(2'),5'-bisphosphate nucleotidase CysQ [Pseudomonadota bacterium]